MFHYLKAKFFWAFWDSIFSNVYVGLSDGFVSIFEQASEKMLLRERSQVKATNFFVNTNSLSISVYTLKLKTEKLNA